MADQAAGKARGKARGRGRASTVPGQVGPATGSVSAPLQGAWGARRPGPQSQPVQQGAAAGAPQQPQPPAPAQPVSKTAGRATVHGGVRRDVQPGAALPEKGDAAVGAGGDGAFAGRGALRGRRMVTGPTETLVTRSKDLMSKQGKSGQVVKLQANYFKMLTTTDWCLYQYRVDLSPEEDRTVVRKGLVRLHKEILGAYIFDGTVMYTSNRLPQPLELFSTRQSDNEQIRITINLVGDMAMGDYHYLQFFNIIMRKCLGHLNLQLVGRNYFDAHARIEVREHRLELWPGYVTSIRQHEHDVLMCSEITHKVMRQQTLLDILNDCYQRCDRDWKRAFSAQVIGLIVLTGYNNATYRVDDVDYSANPKHTFKLRNGDEISFKDYYRNKYQLTIHQDSQPLLISKVKPRERRAGQPELLCLIPELCRATGLTDDMKSDFHLMKALGEHTRVGPENRIGKLLQFNKRLRTEPHVAQDLQEWNLTLADNLIELPGRVYPPEKIVFGRDAKCDAGPQADWTRDLRGNQMLSLGNLSEWVLIVTNRSKRDAQGFVTTLCKAAAGMRFQIAQPKYYEIQDDRAVTYTEALEQVMSKTNPQLIFCIVSNNRSDRYSAIKKKCCVDRPVPTQVFLAKNMNSKGVMSIATKVAIQLNCKIGGAPWTVEIPLSGLMIIGYDVCHDTNSKGRDFGAMVASLDKNFSRYFSAVSAHTTGEELSNDLAVNICKALHKYREVNNALPQRIVVYRDGVGEGQIPYVYTHEVELLKSKLQETYGTQPVRLAYIIVTKRINTRIFLNKSNPPPGTVVDDVITNPERYDFFIVSQSVRQGTVSPTAYNVIYENVGLDGDKLQRLTYKMCHMYYNWSGTVRVPAPCQYAHKLAFLVSQSIHREPDSRLEDLLYFL